MSACPHEVPASGRVRVELPAGSLVVLAGLPGAGKTTLLRRLASSPGVRALDSEDVAARLARPPVPYRLLRPAVHAVHLLTVLASLPGAAPCVLTTDPFTGPGRRWLLRTAARLTGRRLVVVLLDTSADEARDGRRRRGRTLSRRRTARHERRYGALAATPVDLVLTRSQAALAEAVRPRLTLSEPTSGAGSRRARVGR